VFSEVKSALKGQKFQDIEDIKKCESYFTAVLPNMFPTVAALLG
jgi:hypothetical protein